MGRGRNKKDVDKKGGESKRMHERSTVAKQNKMDANVNSNHSSEASTSSSMKRTRIDLNQYKQKCTERPAKTVEHVIRPATMQDDLNECAPDHNESLNQSLNMIRVRL